MFVMQESGDGNKHDQALSAEKLRYFRLIFFEIILNYHSKKSSISLFEIVRKCQCHNAKIKIQ